MNYYEWLANEQQLYEKENDYKRLINKYINSLKKEKEKLEAQTMEALINGRLFESFETCGKFDEVTKIIKELESFFGKHEV